MLSDHLLARPAGDGAGARRIRTLPGAGIDHRDRGARPHEYDVGTRLDADERDPAADDQLGRQFAAVHAGLAGDPHERFGARRMRGNSGTGRCEKIGSAAGRVARNGKSWWRRFGVSPRCNAGTDETFSRRICAEMFRLSPYCPERPIRTASLGSHHSGLSRIRADAVAFPIFSDVPDAEFSGGGFLFCPYSICFGWMVRLLWLPVRGAASVWLWLSRSPRPGPILSASAPRLSRRVARSSARSSR